MHVQCMVLTFEHCEQAIPKSDIKEKQINWYWFLMPAES